MKTRTVILVAMVACLLLGGLALLAAQDSAQAQSNQPPTVQYSVTQGIASGGDYRLAGSEKQVNSASSGGNYRLLGPASPSSGTPCCCLHLPCILK
jgi:hypothetical protein